MNANALWLNWHGVDGDSQLHHSTKLSGGGWSGDEPTFSARGEFPPSAACVDDQQRLLAWSDPDGSILVGPATPTGDLASFEGLSTGFSGRPAIAMTSSQAILVWKATDGGVQWATSHIGGGWARHGRIDGSALTDRAPAVAVLGNTAFCVWKQSGSEHVMWSRHDLGSANWTAPEPIPVVPGGGGVNTSDVPALAVSAGNTLAMAWKGVANNDPHLWYSELGQDGHWSDPHKVVPVDGGVLTTHGPGLAFIGNTPHLAWKGNVDDNRIFWSHRQNDGRWATPQIAGETMNTNAGPSLTSFAR